MAPTPFAELSKMAYKDQLVWFLNGAWTEATTTADGLDAPNTLAHELWNALLLFVELDPNGAEGTSLDEFNAHRVLEKFNSTLSVIKMREALRTIDQDADGKMSFIEYATWQHKKTVDQVENYPQGSADQSLMRAAEEKIAQIQASIEALQPKLKAAQDAYAVVKAAEDEVAAAVAELKAQEDAYAAKCAELEAKSTDTSVGVVTRNKAANELSQLKAEDPLPLRKAKITQEAALRRAEKARAAAEAPKLALEQAYAELEAQMAEAVAQLEEAKQAGGVPQGALWKAEREMFTADESLPRARQKYDHSKPFSMEFQ